MQLIEPIKKAYFAVEDKYYALLDYIDQKLPIYSIIDPIDKVFPSMLLWPVLFILLVVVFSFSSPVAFAGTIKVLDANDNSAIAGATIFLEIDGNSLELLTGEDGTVIFPLSGQNIVANVVVEKNGFKKFSDTTEFGSGSVKEILLEKTILSFSAKKKIVLLDNETGQKLSDTVVSLSFSCSTNSIAPEDSSTENAEFETAISEECGTLFASASASGFEKKNNIALTEETTEIKLEKANVNGKIFVSIEDEAGSIIEGANFRLFDEDGLKKDDTVSDASGTAVFENVKPGTYSISALLSDSRFGKKEEIVVPSSGTADAKIIVPALASGKRIFLKIIDSQTKEPISDAELIVFSEKDFLLTANSGADGSFEKAVEEGKNYTILAEHSSFVSMFVIPQIKEPSDFSAQTIELEKAKEDNSNYCIVNVNVADFDSKKPVDGANVLLYNEEFDFIPISYPSKESNAGGSTFFANLPAGTYSAKAKKDDSDGNSSKQSLLLGQSADLNISLVLQTGDFEITVTDSTGTAIMDANVLFFDSKTNALLDVQKTDSSGKAKSKAIKSDKAVFFIVTKEAFLPYATIARVVVPKTTQKFQLLLTSSLFFPEEKNLAMQFRGFYKDNALSKKETILKSGAEPVKYFLKFEIALPKEANYYAIASHFRTGRNEQNSLSDNNYSARITDSIASPEKTSILSSCFDITNNYSNPENCMTITNGAKQANTFWEIMQGPIVMEQLSTIEIEPNLPAGSEVRFYFKAKATVEGTETITAEAAKSYRVGQRVCENDCPNFLWNITMQNGNGQQVQLDNFSRTNAKELLLNEQYSMQCTILNTKPAGYEAKLFAENKNPSGIISINGKKTPGNEIFSMAIAEQSEKSCPQFTIKTINEASYTELQLQLQTTPASLDNNLSMFFSIFESNSLATRGLAKNLDPRMPNQEINAQLFDANTELPVNGTVYRVYKDNETETIATGFNDTNLFSYKITEPAVNFVIVEFEKPGYQSLSQKIPVTETNYDQNYDCIIVDKNSLNLQKGQSETIKIKTNNCSERTEAAFQTEIKTSAETILLGQNEETTVTITADAKTGQEAIAAGEYSLIVKARLLSDISFLTAKKIPITITDPNNCFVLSKTSFDFSTSQSIKATVKNKCPAELIDVLMPSIELDTEKASVSFNPYNLPQTASFSWNTIITGTEKYSGGRQEITAKGTTHSSTINTTQQSPQFVGIIDVGLENLEKDLSFKKGFIENAIISTENNSNGLIETWIAGNSVYARYLGKPFEINQEMEFTLSNNSIMGTEYALLTVKNYTNRKRT